MQEKICLFFRKNIIKFYENKLELNDLRKFIYHIDNCKECNDTLIDEYTFYVVFNDLDNNINQNYSEMLSKIILDAKRYIQEEDNKIIVKYVLYSLLIIFIICFLFILIVRFIYR